MLTKPFVASVPVPLPVTRSNEPDVIPEVALESCIPIPVVRASATKLKTVPAVVSFAFISTNPPLTAEVLVKSPVWVKDTMPFVAMAPVPPVVTRSNEPEVIADEPLERCTPKPVVKASATKLKTTPAVVSFALISTNPPSVVDVLVKLPVSENEITPLVPKAPAVEVVARIREPVVIPVVLTIESPTPTIAAAIVNLRSVVALAASVASVLNSTIVPVEVVAPVWSIDNKRPAPVIAVADEAMAKPKPLVRALRFIILIPFPVVIATPLTSNTAPTPVKAAEAVSRNNIVSSAAAVAISAIMPETDALPV